ncbi:MAG TPA: succinate dehydrogenase, cytochrome b556 subunit [Anaerolineae bacterium]|nr:succinate dehydrogenase, cytochrome b556 subunit [Anaerolineae bacterium]HID83989.1 succinate dehydrogenase, cytochrome b556 subunit [Anaerolineales bacterium]HIQ09834.1 succinate dehydrogenase, cytochrome b556 subunit [Anaerolineaceae bacterium]
MTTLEEYSRPKPKAPRPSIGEWFRVNKRGVANWAFVLHRLTGIVLVLYLFLHLFVLRWLTLGPDSYQEILTLFRQPWITALEAVLIGTVVYHGLNGLRLGLMTLNVGLKYHKAMFWAALALSVVLTLLAAWFMF